MPFFVYNVSASNGQKTYSSPRSIKLAGASGPFAQVYKAKNPTGTTPHEWHASEMELLTHIPGTQSAAGASLEIVIDLKPREETNVSFYRLRDAWGYTADGWTPLALALEALLVDEPFPTGGHRANFTLTAKDKVVRVGEFLYLQNCTAAGKNRWTWGRVGSVNGALLWPAAFNYLSAHLRKSLCP